jgi:hypothetical protein
MVLVGSLGRPDGAAGVSLCFVPVFVLVYGYEGTSHEECY